MNGRRTVASVHNDWLTLVEPVGAFLTIPVLKRVFPNGIAPVDRDMRANVRQRLDELTTDVAARTAWLQWIVRDLLSLGPRFREASAIPAGLTHTVAERHTILRPDFVIVEPQKDGPDRPRLLAIRWPLRTLLDSRPTTDERGQPTAWAATPLERAALLCRAVNVPLALVTDTDRFALVWAPVNGPSGHAIWTSSLFGEERLLLDSFVAVLGAQRFFGVAEKQTLEALLTESGSAQAEVTGKLGEQVRKAVELLVDAFSRADRTARGRILAAVQPAQVYNAAVTVLMRLVVLLAAEERRLLPADDPIYAASYSILTTRDQLERDAMRDGIETLEKRHTAWHRLLATFRAVHTGIEHDRLRLPAYGGSLFDSARYPFLDEPPIPVDDRAMLAVLDALQVLSFRQGSVTEARRISYLNLDVEQIGHVYEGLLDHGCARVDEVVLGLIGSKGVEPEIALSDLERELLKGEDSFGEWVAEKGGPQASRVRKLLFEDLDPDQDHRLRAACDNDQPTYDRVRPFGGLLRKDLRELPAVFMPGALYVTQVSLRRDSGTAYTTKELADEVVQYALEPLVYSPGPAEGAAPDDWRLKPSTDLLRLKVCDPAVGSGAILVAACRYLADRLVEAWQAEAGAGALPAVLEGVHEDDWTLVARRSVTDHCLYGVDRNPMALEMAKLSLWLTTMAKERPFTFLDHQVRSGDSLLGITSLDQVRWVHIDPERGKKLWAKKPLFTDPRTAVDARVTGAFEKALALAAIDVISLGDVDRKSRLHEEMVDALEPLGVLADAVIGAALAEAGGEGNVDALLQSLANRIETGFNENAAEDARERSLAEVRDQAQFWLDTDDTGPAGVGGCLHWPLAFPEVFSFRGGFDAVIGNPPYLGGTRISGRFGKAYRGFIANAIAGRRTDRADLVVFFFLRAASIAREQGSIGYLATDKILEAASRDVGLRTLVSGPAVIYRATSSRSWPGASMVSFVQVWLMLGTHAGPKLLDNVVVQAIGPDLRASSGAIGEPLPLARNRSLAFIGSKLGSRVFVVEHDDLDGEAIAKLGRPLRQYLIGDDLNNSPEPSASRYVIDFSTIPPEEVHQYRVALDFLESRWRRAGGSLEGEWWLFQRRAKELYSAISSFDTVIAIAETSRTLMPIKIPNRFTFANSVTVFTTNDDYLYSVLTSSIHREWAWTMCGTHESGNPRYIPSRVVAPFPVAPEDPSASAALRTTIERLHQHRQEMMGAYGKGLSSIYTLFNDPHEASQSVVELRELHRKLDSLIAPIYGVSGQLVHDFQSTPQGVRFTISAENRNEVLSLLYRWNLRYHAEEVAQGLHEQSASKARIRSLAKKDKKGSSPLLEGV